MQSEKTNENALCSFEREFIVVKKKLSRKAQGAKDA